VQLQWEVKTQHSAHIVAAKSRRSRTFVEPPTPPHFCGSLPCHRPCHDPHEGPLGREHRYIWGPSCTTQTASASRAPPDGWGTTGILGQPNSKTPTCENSMIQMISSLRRQRAHLEPRNHEGQRVVSCLVLRIPQKSDGSPLEMTHFHP